MKTFTPLSAAGLAAALLNLGAFLVPQTARAQDPVEVTFTAPAAGQSVTVGTDVLFDAAFTNLTGNSYQVTDANGQVTFTTIFPGWYDGRTTHIHYRVRTTLSSTTTTAADRWGRGAREVTGVPSVADDRVRRGCHPTG